MVQGRGKGPETLTGDAIRGSQNSDLRLVSSDRQRRLLGHVYLLLKLHSSKLPNIGYSLHSLLARLSSPRLHAAFAGQRTTTGIKKVQSYSRENTVVSG